MQLTQQTDWRQAWIEHNKRQRPAADALFWDSRAKDFSHYAGNSHYADEFISNLNLKPNQTILDMGAGSGALAIPLARAGHKVLAVDFSPKMLEYLGQSAKQEGLDTIRTTLLDFNAPWSEWEAAGVTEKSVDVALASRSTMVEDLWDAFEKLERVARYKVAITAKTKDRLFPCQDGAPEPLLDNSSYLPDHVYAQNILLQMGRKHILRYINAYKLGEQGKARHVHWAFISWDVKQVNHTYDKQEFHNQKTTKGERI